MSASANSWVLFALGSAFFAGLTALLSKIGVEDISSNVATFVRTVVILCLLTLVVWARGEWQAPWLFPKKSLFFLVLSGGTTGLSWLCYYRALQLGPVSLVASIDKLSFVMAIVLAVAILGEHLTGRQWTGAALMSAGVLLILLK